MSLEKLLLKVETVATGIDLHGRGITAKLSDGGPSICELVQGQLVGCKSNLRRISGNYANFINLLV